MAEPPILSWEGLGLQQGKGWLFGGPDTGGLDLHGPTIGRNRSYDDVGVHAPN